jgi:hypothetical protein
MTTKLRAFLSDSHKSGSREYILTTRLVHDLTVAAAERGYDLLVYLPTVDSDGFDVIVDDRDRLVPIQLKSIVKGGKVSQWKIRRKLIRPEPEFAELYGFESSPNGVGRAGGVILTTVVAAGEAKVDVWYAYTDVDVLSGDVAGDSSPQCTSEEAASEAPCRIDGRTRRIRSAAAFCVSPCSFARASSRSLRSP